MVAAEVLASGPGGRFDVGRVVRRTFGVMRRNLAMFAGWSVLLSAVPYVLLNWGKQVISGDNAVALLGTVAALVGWVVTVAGAYLLQAAVVHATVADLNGKRVSFGAGLSTGTRHMLSLLGLAFLSTLAYGAAAILLVVPALILMSMWAVAAPALVVEHLGVTESLGRSLRLTKGSRWQVFALCLIYGVLIFGVAFALGAAGLMVGDKTQSATLVQLVVGGVYTAATALLAAAGASAIYYELRSAKEGVGAETLASVFD